MEHRQITPRWPTAIQSLKPVTLCLCYLIVVGAACLVTKQAAALQSWAVVVTGAVIVWYTWETRQLRVATFRQVELALRPFVVLQPNDSGFKLTNVGSGVALNVVIDDVRISEEFDLTIRFPDSVAVLRPDETLSVRAESFSKGNAVGDFFCAHLDPCYATLTLSITLRYDNADLKSYVVTQQIAPGKLEIVGFA